MSAVAKTGAAGTAAMSPLTRVQRWIADRIAVIIAIAVLLYLFVPVAYTFVFSFNDYRKSNITWSGFTLKHWENPCGAPGVCDALQTSIKVGFLATLIATMGLAFFAPLLVKVAILTSIKTIWFDAPSIPENGSVRVADHLLDSRGSNPEGGPR